MEIVFIRHGQGEHTLSLPQSLQIVDPALTELGRAQATRLLEKFPLSANDTVIISPTRRTVQTALCWGGNVACRMIIHPLVGPRMFPLLSAEQAYPCDQTLGTYVLVKEYPQMELADVDAVLWTNGINSLSEYEFQGLADQFLVWCRQLGKETLYIVTHDGTITSFRAYLGETVTRIDFLGETGFYRMDL